VNRLKELLVVLFAVLVVERVLRRAPVPDEPSWCAAENFAWLKQALFQRKANRGRCYG
jgi:hypothetical protein